jgi:hypothetical protein
MKITLASRSDLAAAFQWPRHFAGELQLKRIYRRGACAAAKTWGDLPGRFWQAARMAQWLSTFCAGILGAICGLAGLAAVPAGATNYDEASLDCWITRSCTTSVSTATPASTMCCRPIGTAFWILPTPISNPNDYE